MNSWLPDNQIIAILRGLPPEDAANVGKALYQSGTRVMEVPLNRPQALSCITILRENLPSDCIVGAGTVINITQVEQVKNAGGQLIVSPNCDSDLIDYTLELGLISLPGIATASEAFQAYHAGATTLKVFPAASYGTDHIKALTSVLPPECALIAVGGVSIENRHQWLSAGARAVGIGSHLYQQGDNLSQIQQKIKGLV
ncbi:2-dehydro-3-deoxy-6-phosphogalactonate aldolase [Thalassotalea euphylliae]|uniref:2-dehydro-3-deoxy-6-phosphogalactonate aldolase n=1 Tax=Thalassotalea euphylliae TaxID=1655234 RepID=UPI001C6E64B4|nr:2-dehydro-3-deoxy-6-phosphogalactonate aldolase [Thalassotalea euphylliae]